MTGKMKTRDVEDDGEISVRSTSSYMVSSSDTIWLFYSGQGDRSTNLS